VDAIFKKLEAEGALNDRVKRRLEELWKFGVKRIVSMPLQLAVYYLLEEIVPWQFYVAPAAVGKHHPSWQLREGGLVRHTTEMCLGCGRYVQQFPEFTDETCVPLIPVMDILLTAICLHDAFKNGIPWGAKTDHFHHQIAADEWAKAAEKFEVHPKVRQVITEAIFWHAGRWTPGWTLEKNRQRGPLAKIVHTLDMIYSDVDLALMYSAKNLLMKRVKARSV